MSEITQYARASASSIAGRLNPTWKRFIFFFYKRAFESKLEGILSAAAGHEANSLPAGNYQYQVLNAHANSLCTEFADRWNLDQALLRARIPGLAKLAELSIRPPAKSKARLACIGIIAVPLALFLLGVLARLISVGFHLVGGR